MFSNSVDIQNIQVVMFNVHCRTTEKPCMQLLDRGKKTCYVDTAVDRYEDKVYNTLLSQSLASS